jgi:beta-galactosidase/beta-glucuronidase
MKYWLLLAGFLVFQRVAFSAQAECVHFDRPFAPQSGLVCRYEEPLRQEICLNGHWRFQGDADASVPGETIPPLATWDKTEIKIPSPWNVNGFFAGQPGGDFRAYPSYPTEWETLRAAWMEKTVTVPKDWEGKRIILHFGAVAGRMVVYVNGQWAGGGFDIFFPQEFDVTKMIQFGTTNQILIKVIAPKVFDKPGSYGHREYLSGSFWGTFIAGIWQDVFLIAEPKVAVSDAFVQSWVNQDTLSVETTVANHGSTPATISVSGDVREWINDAGNSVLEAPDVKWRLARRSSLKLAAREMTLAPGESRTITLTAKVNGRLKLWNPNTPNLYGLLLTVSADRKPVDVKYQRFGWRQFTFDKNKLLLNGQLITLRGDSWHFLGVPQMTRRYA